MDRALIDQSGTLTCNPWEWVPLAWSGMDFRGKSVGLNQPAEIHADGSSCSSAKDQLTGQAVAVKKIMKPFSTPVLSKRTYRELKLLKHLRHENVWYFAHGGGENELTCMKVISLSDIFISPLEDMYDTLSKGFSLVARLMRGIFHRPVIS